MLGPCEQNGRADVLNIEALDVPKQTRIALIGWLAVTSQDLHEQYYVRPVQQSTG